MTMVKLDVEELRNAIRREYQEVALNPEKGFHFHTGRPLAQILGYPEEWIDSIPAIALESLAGTGNPFSLGRLREGEHVVDVGSGAGVDSLIAARMVGPTGQVIGVDMTPQMLRTAQAAAQEAGVDNVLFREGLAEQLPVEDGWADVIISNGVVNLCPDKGSVFREMFRVLRPGGRLQIADILVEEAIPEEAKEDIDLWTG